MKSKAFDKAYFNGPPIIGAIQHFNKTDRKNLPS